MLKTIELKKSEMLDMYGYCNEYKNPSGHTKDMKYSALYAKKKLEPYATALLETYKPSDEYIEYEQKKIEIVRKSAEKDTDGNPVELKMGIYKIAKDIIDSVTEDIKALELEYKTTIEERDRDFEEFDKKLDETIEVELEMISFDKISDEDSYDFIEAMMPIIIK